MTLLLAAVVEVGILGLLHPRQIVVERAAGGTVAIKRAEPGIEWVDGGRTNRGDHVSVAGSFAVRLPDGFRRAYRGELMVRPEGEGLALVLKADVEDLVTAIVAAESPPGAPGVSMEALAVLARSWLLASRGRHGSYDVCDTTHCQHFKEPTAAGRRAAAATRGLVLTYQGKVFAPAYSASCGGRTKTAAEIGWSEERGRYPYFALECRVCRRAEKNWVRSFNGTDATALRERPNAESTRLLLGRKNGWDTLPSNNYELEKIEGGVRVTGRGQGHGLGYCQRGGAGMAAEGAGLAEILRYYFPGTSVEGIARE